MPLATTKCLPEVANDVDRPLTKGACDCQVPDVTPHIKLTSLAASAYQRITDSAAKLMASRTGRFIGMKCVYPKITKCAARLRTSWAGWHTRIQDYSP